MGKKAKRKLNSNQNDSDAIPYSKVRVEWIDILSDSGWADDKQFNKMKLAFPVKMLRLLEFLLDMMLKMMALFTFRNGLFFRLLA